MHADELGQERCLDLLRLPRTRQEVEFTLSRVQHPLPWFVENIQDILHPDRGPLCNRIGRERIGPRTRCRRESLRIDRRKRKDVHVPMVPGDNDKFRAGQIGPRLQRALGEIDLVRALLVGLGQGLGLEARTARPRQFSLGVIEREKGGFRPAIERADPAEIHLPPTRKQR